MEFLDESRLVKLVYGGAVLGAGGGGFIEAGLAAGRAALARGRPRLAQIEELPSKSLIATLSIVGSIGGGTADHSRPQHGWALRRLAEAEKKSVEATIPSEVGPEAVTYGWRESAVYGLPIVDAPCNGRAHPLGVMGALDLHRRPSYIAVAAAVGGGPDSHNHIDLLLRTSANKSGRMIRHSAATSGIPLAVARNPLPACYVRKHAAVGGLKYAAQLGAIVLREIGHGLAPLLEHLARFMGGRVLFQGRVSSTTLNETRGFTLGHILLNEECRVAVCNEFVAFTRQGVVLAAFPDLITLFDFDSSLPLTTPQVKLGMRVAALAVPRSRLRLGSTMKDYSLLLPIERLLNLQLIGNGMSTSDPAAQSNCKVRRA
jgi:uncharacterized protein